MRLRYTRRAAKELDQLLSYIDDRSPRGAAEVKARIRAIIDLIALHPMAGRPMPRRSLRRVVVHPFPYLVFYAVSEDEIVIHGVRHAARRPLSTSR